MEKKKETEYVGSVNGVQVKATTKKDFIFAYLTELANQSKGKDVIERITNYINYFIDNFRYDEELKSNKLGNINGSETREGNEENLFNLLYKGLGTCEEFAKAFSLLCCVAETWRNGLVCEYGSSFITVNKDGKKTDCGHAMNHISAGKLHLIVDLSSMIHCTHGDYKVDKNNFYFVSLKEYERNLEEVGVELGYCGENTNVQFANYYVHTSFEEYYNRLITPTQEVVKNYQDWIHGVSIDKDLEV